MRAVLPLLAAVTSLAACPPAQAPDAGEDAAVAVTPVELCDRLATARCELQNRCYPAFARFAGDRCVSFEQAACLAEYETLKPSFDDGRVLIDEPKLRACEDRMKTSACPPSFPPDYPAAVARPFADCGLQTGLLTGTVPTGQLCQAAVDCAPGAVCVKPGGVCRGTCSTSPVEGQGCAFGCAAGLFCGGDGGCQRPQALDAPCAASAECQADLICASGACRPRRKLSESCAWDPDRLSVCEPGLACDVVPWVQGATGTCVRPRDSGGPCRFHWSCAPGLVCADIDWSPFPNAAPAGGFCRAPDVAESNCPRTQYGQYVGDQCAADLGCAADTGKCKPLPVMGDPCTPSLQSCAGTGVYCKPSGAGDTGTCTGPAATGERCSFRLDAQRTATIPCALGYCDPVNTQQCRPPSKPQGALCAEGGECLSGRCAVQQDRTLRCADAC